MNNDWNVINKTMDFLKFVDNPLSREAVVIMIDEGILTQETKFINYIVAKNVYEALLNRNNKGEYKDEEFLIRSLYPSEQKELLRAWALWLN